MRNIIFKSNNLHRLDIYILYILYGVKEVTVSREETDGLDRRHLTKVHHLDGNGNIYFSLDLLLVGLFAFAAGEVLLFVVPHVDFDTEFLETKVENFVLGHSIVVIG
jgi:hypothetical protein